MNMKQIIIMIIVLALVSGVSAATTFIDLNSTGTVYGQQLMWKKPYFGTYDEQGSPIYADGVLYFNSIGHSKIYAVDSTTGDEIWSVSVGSGGNGYGGPVYDAGIIYDAFNSILAINATNGNIIWNFTTPGSLYSQGVAIDDNYVVGIDYNNAIIMVLNKTDGTQIWNATYGTKIATEPLLHGDYLVIATSGGATPNNNLRVYNVTDGTLIWSVATSDSYGFWRNSPILYDNKIQIGEDKDWFFKAYNIADGTVNWSFTAIDNIQGTASVYNDTVVFGTQGVLGYPIVLYKLNATTGTLIWNTDDTLFTYYDSNAEYRESNIATSGGLIFDSVFGYAVNSGSIYVFNGSTKERIFKKDFGLNNQSFGSVSISGGDVYFFSDDKYLYKYDFGLGSGNWPMVGYDTNRTGYSPTGLTAWENINATCSVVTSSNTTCTVKNTYTENVTNITLNYSSNVWWTEDGLLVASNVSNYTITDSNFATNDIRTYLLSSTEISKLLLISPSNSSWGSSTPDLNWSTVTSSDFNNYTVELDNNQDFSSPEYTYTTTSITDSNYTVTSAITGGRYYWHVTAWDTTGNRNMSEYYIYNVQKTLPAGTTFSVILISVGSFFAVLFRLRRT